jgi:hypothetical protein
MPRGGAVFFWTARAMRVLSLRHEAGRSVRVVEDGFDGSRLYFDGPALYTHVDAQGGNLLAYVSAMERALAGAPTVLMLGTAGGALATQLSRAGAAVTAVDDWLTAFELARRWFHLPDNVECIHADALALLRETDRRWSAVAIDVFHGVEIPDDFLTADVGRLLTRVVEPGGLIVWNVADGPRSRAATWIVKALRLQGLRPSIVSVIDVDVGNTLVVCRNSPGEPGDLAGPLVIDTSRSPPARPRETRLADRTASMVSGISPPTDRATNASASQGGARRDLSPRCGRRWRSVPRPRR